MIRTILIDDDPSVIEKLSLALTPHDDIKVIGTASGFEEGKALIGQGGYDVLMVDLGLPGGDGVNLIRYSRQLYPDADVVVITVFAHQNRVLESIRAGATGYLLKDERLEDCAARLREVRHGGAPISPTIARNLLKQMRPDQDDDNETSVEKLSERETEVLNLLARGFSYVDIAKMLGLTTGTVQTYVKRMYRKLEVGSRAEAVFEAASRGIINVH